MQSFGLHQYINIHVNRCTHGCYLTPSKHSVTVSQCHSGTSLEEIAIIIIGLPE